MLRSPTISIKAKLKIFPKENCDGRETPIRTGYRPNHVFEYIDGRILQTYIGEIRFDEFETIAPSEEKDVLVVFLPFPQMEQYLKVGRKWWIHEGARKVGEAIITEIVCHE
jgi:translation elongation factor EF-Tu-like GTPase